MRYILQDGADLRVFEEGHDAFELGLDGEEGASAFDERGRRHGCSVKRGAVACVPDPREDPAAEEDFLWTFRVWLADRRPGLVPPADLPGACRLAVALADAEAAERERLRRRRTRRHRLCVGAVAGCCGVICIAFLGTFFSLASGRYTAWVRLLLSVILGAQAVAALAFAACPRRLPLLLLALSAALTLSALALNLHRVL